MHPSTATPRRRPGRGGLRPRHRPRTLGSSRRSGRRATKPKPPQLADADPAAVVQRLPRQPRAAERLLAAATSSATRSTPRPASRSTPPQDAGGVEYLATHLEQAREGHPQHPDRRRRRHHRRLAAALGRLPRRADHRVDEQARPRRHARWATTSSTRATRSSSGWPTAAASTTATAPNNQNSCPDRHVQRRELRLPRRQRRSTPGRARRSCRRTRSRTSTAPRSASSG